MGFSRVFAVGGQSASPGSDTGLLGLCSFVQVASRKSVVVRADGAFLGSPTNLVSHDGPIDSEAAH